MPFWGAKIILITKQFGRFQFFFKDVEFQRVKL
jgi:hypothetical protein